MRVFVTGVKGQLGYDVMNELEKQGLEGIGVDIDEMDITDADQVNKVIKEAAPDAVIHCAAYSAQTMYLTGRVSDLGNQMIRENLLMSMDRQNMKGNLLSKNM